MRIVRERAKNLELWYQNKRELFNFRTGREVTKTQQVGRATSSGEEDSIMLSCFKAPCKNSFYVDGADPDWKCDRGAAVEGVMRL